jgi:hypothetical protein
LYRTKVAGLRAFRFYPCPIPSLRDFPLTLFLTLTFILSVKSGERIPKLRENGE